MPKEYVNNSNNGGKWMLIKVLLCYICGYIRVSVEGYYIERFINICTNKKIIIWNLKRDKNVKL